MEMLEKTPKYQRKVQNTSDFLCQWQRRLKQKCRMKDSKKFFVNELFAALFMRQTYEWFWTARREKIATFRSRRRRSRLLVNRMTSLSQRQQIVFTDKSFKALKNGRIAGNR